MFTKLVVSFCVVSMLADANGSPFGSGLFDVVKKPAETAKDALQQPLQPILSAFGAPLNRQSRAAQSDSSSSGSPSGLFDIVKKPAEVIRDVLEKPFQPILGAFGAPVSRASRASDDSLDSKKKDDEHKDDDKKDDEKNDGDMKDHEKHDDDKKGDEKNDDDKKGDEKKDDDKNSGKLPFQPLFDIFGSQVHRVSGAFSALLSPSSSNKQ